MEVSTQGFIKGVAVNSPVGSAFELLANPAGDWLFMAGMLGAGDTLGLWAPGGLVWSATPGCADAADAVLTDERAQAMY